MITYNDTDIFESDAEALVNPVNCVGVMGRGLALQFKNRYPQYFNDYKTACNNSMVRPGTCHVYNHNGLHIISFPTKDHWRNPSKLQYISDGLDDLKTIIHDNSIASIAMPMLGCGLGGLSWDDVRPIIHEKLENMNANIFIHIPNRP